ncbi:tyrosine-type recombinase/integrase [Haloarcula argentinensis]|nr:site-specific integrase [Haloarcula argentinensis]
MSEVDGYHVEQWKLQRKDDGIKQITLVNNVKHLRRFIKWCESASIVQSGLYDKIEVPSVSREQEASQDKVTQEKAEKILEYLEVYEYATRQHALFQFLWHTGCRISGAVSLDLCDYDPQQNHVKFRDRGETGTALKNGGQGERNVTLSENVIEVLNDYIAARREEVDDKHGRQPLFTTSEGRMRRQRAYKDFVAVSRPCVYTNDCPHNREIEDCDATLKKRAYKCPSSLSLHPIRRGSITRHLKNSWPKEAVSERCDVSVGVLEKHYDARNEEEKRLGRREFTE